MTENIVNDVENFGKLETNDGIITTSEQQKNITEFGRRLGRIETEIKARKLDIKELKHEFDLEGVSIRVVCKAIRNIKQTAEEYKNIIPKKVYDALYIYKVNINNDKNWVA